MTENFSDLFKKETFDEGFLKTYRHSLNKGTGKKRLPSTMPTYCVYLENVCTFITATEAESNLGISVHDINRLKS